IQTTDLALGQEVANDIYSRISSIKDSLVVLSPYTAADALSASAMNQLLAAFKIGRDDVDLVYWLDTQGVLRVSAPSSMPSAGVSFANVPVFQRALTSNGPVVEAGLVDPIIRVPVVTVAEPVRDNRGALLGVLAANIEPANLGLPTNDVIQAQAAQGQHLLITVLDEQGRLLVSPQTDQVLGPIAAMLPGATDALAGSTVTRQGKGPDGSQWLYGSVPVPGLGWAVVVQRPVSDLSPAVSTFRVWLVIATVLFALGGLLFWLVLLRRLIRPLHALAGYKVASMVGDAPLVLTPQLQTLGLREDEIGGLARSLKQLNRDVLTQLAELRTLLETSNAVVTSLDPRDVGRTIIREVRRLVDVQAATVLVPDDTGTLRVLVSEGRAEHYEEVTHVDPDQLTFPSARALHDGRPVQMIDDGNPAFPRRAFEEGFRAVLAIPIISKRVGGVVLGVHRREPQPFDENEINLLLTFANYATLAWEHAVLYERSDERLREVAQENERLYHQTEAEKRTLSAIMGSVSDGLLLTGVEGTVLYANPRARALVRLPEGQMEGERLETIHAALRASAEDPDQYERDRVRAEASEIHEWLFETQRDRDHHAIRLRLFEVRDEQGAPIGRGLLLRDVTRERELDIFKTTLLAAVGHELRTPLAAIKGHASTLLQDDVTWPVDDQRHFLATISSEADHLAELVSNLLDLSRVEAGLLLLHRGPVALHTLVANAANRLNLTPGTLSVELAENLPLVDVDVARIEVVLQNMLSNAAKYGDGLVRLSGVVEDGMVHVRVSDNGPGISPEDAPHIFERFYRARHARRQQVGGTGLGLAICKAFVEAHGGTIWAESGEHGTSIAFTLPIYEQADGAGAPAETRPEAAVSPGGGAV
ncbi:MAG TPA: ATP-binding protein, partial [Ktedonobacterales bacterium]|nr:ATP-binding protein [Ktedonobacterales bacterium]